MPWPAPAVCIYSAGTKQHGGLFSVSIHFLHNPSSSRNSNWKKEKYWSDSIMWFLNSYLLVAAAATGESPHLPVSLRFRYGCKSSCFPYSCTWSLQKTDIQIKQTKPELFIQLFFCDYFWKYPYVKIQRAGQAHVTARNKSPKLFHIRLLAQHRNAPP